MSYCRFSSDNWRSEVYAYPDSGGGYTIHVAGNRVVGEIPPEPSWNRTIDDAWMAEHRAVLDFLDAAEREPIGGAFDGAYFNEPDLASFLARMEAIRDAGYNVPADALDEIRAELSDCRALPGGGEPTP